MSKTARPSQKLDLRPVADEDEARFAAQFYSSDWVFEEYQRDRILMSQSLLYPLPLPTGHVMMLGTHNAVVFDAWCRYWGYGRCIGYDLFNEVCHPRVRVRDVRTMMPEDAIPVALAWNDIGSWDRTPEARHDSYRWIRDLIVPNGYYLERGNDVAGWDLSTDMRDNGFEISQVIWDGAYILYERTSPKS